MRRYHIQKINKHNKEQNEKIEEAKRGNTNRSNPISGPNINPSSTYNF